MPIDPIVIQRRLTEVGRIRLGEKVPTKNGGSRPGKLSTFRMTSPDQRLIEAVAELYGGQAEPWDNGGLSEYQVTTTSDSLPVIVVENGVSQWMETWSGGGCVHRCTGVTDHTDPNNLRPCNPDDPKHQQARPTTRLSIMLRDIESMGTWRLETKGFNAAAELPMIAMLAAKVSSMVPAQLRLVERRSVSDGETKRFVVPILDLGITKAGLLEAVGGASQGQLEAPARQEIAAAPQASPLALWQDQIDGCESVEEVSTLWREIVAAGQLYPDVKTALEERGRELQAEEPPAAPPSRQEPASVSETPAAEETVEAEIVVEDPPVDETPGEVLSDPIEDDRAWQDLVAALGKKGMATSEILTAYEAWAGHKVDQGNASSYRAFAASQ